MWTASFRSREGGDSAPDAVCVRSCRMSCETTKIDVVPKSLRKGQQSQRKSKKRAAIALGILRTKW